MKEFRALVNGRLSTVNATKANLLAFTVVTVLVASLVGNLPLATCVTTVLVIAVSIFAEPRNFEERWERTRPWTLRGEHRRAEENSPQQSVQEFIEKFPDSPIAGKARSQLRKHMTERKILENRKNATTLRTWEIKLKGEGMFVREVPADKLFELIGRPPDSSKKGSNSQYKQFTYVWRDYVLGQGGAYYDLLIHRTDDKVDRISFEE